MGLSRIVPLVVALVASLLIASKLEFVESRLFDLRLGLRRDAGWPADLTLVPIDDAALAESGPWPWPSATLAALLERLRALGVRTVALDVELDATGDPEADRVLARALRETVIAVLYTPGRRGEPAVDGRSALVPGRFTRRVPADAFRGPPSLFSDAAAGRGHTFAHLPPDARIRASPPLLPVEPHRAVPSLPLAAFLRHRGIDPASVEGADDRLAIPGRAPIRLYAGEMFLDLVPGGEAPRRVPASAILRDEAPRLDGALAIVHVETGADRHASPLSPSTPGGELLAYAVRTIETGRTPRVAHRGAAFAAAVLAALVSVRFVPRRWTFAALAGGGFLYLAASVALVPLADLFFPVLLPAIFLDSAAVLSRLNDARPPAGR